jgi:hypothetical protein
VKYALLLYVAPEARPAPAVREERWVEYTRTLKDAGVLVGVEALSGTETATTVRERGGERLLTDGPFVETKEHLLGFYLIDVPDLDAALDWAGRMPHIGYGAVEVRPLKLDMAWRAVLDE